jgi:hypothetical protein
LREFQLLNAGADEKRRNIALFFKEINLFFIRRSCKLQVRVAVFTTVKIDIPKTVRLFET